MKALEILKEINEQINESSNYDFVAEVHYNKAYQARVKKAIEELKDLINDSYKGKTCEGCSNYRTYADGLKHCILYEGYFDFFCSRGHWIDDYYNKGIDYYKNTDLSLLQYTGLKDKNGVEIYDKDIIRDGSRLWIVEISNLYGVVLRLLKDKKITRPYVKFEKHLIDGFEVIGNIYENPELLN